MEDIQMKGDIRMQRLHVYQEIEHSQIGDKNEGLIHSLQPDKIQAWIDGELIEGMLPPLQIADLTYNPFIFCLYAFITKDIEKKTRPFIDERCTHFGQAVLVFNNLEALFSRIKKAVESLGISSLNGRLVEYVDSDSYHGDMGIFKKYSEYQHQSEYRLVLDNRCNKKIFHLNIGSLEDITQLIQSDKLDSLLEIKTHIQPQKTENKP